MTDRQRITQGNREHTERGHLAAMDSHHTLERPNGACLLHRPPTDDTRPWQPADPGYSTCSRCLDRLREQMRDIATRYHQLDPAPGASGDTGSRGAPGFGSRSPASDHVIALRDPRSSQTAKVWFGHDGRVHAENERPPPSVRGELDTLAWTVADERGVDGPDSRADVPGLLRFIDSHLDWATRCDVCVEIADTVRRLLGALRPVTGDPSPRYVGHCPNIVDIEPDLGWAPAFDKDPGVAVRCGAQLYAPTRGDTISCRACGHTWPRPDWLQLGRELQLVA